MKNPHWHYFVALCEDLEKTSRFVEPVSDNFNCYSMEFARLFLAIGSEVDVVAKLLCEKIDPKAKVRGIDNYRPVIVKAFPKLPEVEVIVPHHDIFFTPWKKWANEANPIWWKSHNSVKHQRNIAFKEANLENVLNALGGLLILVGYLYGDELGNKELSPSYTFIQFDKKYFGGFSMGHRGNVAGFWLPGITKPKWLQDQIAKANATVKAKR